MNDTHRLRYILTGASGSGKTTMGRILSETYGLRRCITSTTRPPREGETDGVDYHFRTHLDPSQLFEYAQFGGFEYGISMEELEQGDFIILDPKGVEYYRSHYPNPLIVIQLVRDNIHVDPDRMARDRAAGFDCLNPDYIVRGNTIEEMATALISTIRQTSPFLSQKLALSQPQAHENSQPNYSLRSKQVLR